MTRKDAEKLADEIFDMIDRNHPRGLIKSELTDLLAKFEPETWTPIGDIELGFDDMINHWNANKQAEDRKTLTGLGYYFRPDQCGND